MPQHLSEAEMERIREFAQTPVFKREPEQLLPDDAHQE